MKNELLLPIKVAMKCLLLICCIIFCVVGCVSLQVQHLPAYDVAFSMANAVERPKIFFADVVKIDTAITPYAVIIGTSDDGNTDYLIRAVWHKAAELKSDIVLLKDGGNQYAGQSATAMPIGSAVIAFSQPVYQRALYGYCYRINPSRLGVEVDQSQMIISIENDEVRAVGIIEGDKLLSVNNIPFSSGSPEFLKIDAGQVVNVTVIRPGTGKIERQIKMAKNPATFLNLFRCCLMGTATSALDAARNDALKGIHLSREYSKGRKIYSLSEIELAG